MPAPTPTRSGRLHRIPMPNTAASGPGQTSEIAQPTPKIAAPTTCRRSGFAIVQRTGSPVMSERTRARRSNRSATKATATAVANISHMYGSLSSSMRWIWSGSTKCAQDRRKPKPAPSPGRSRTRADDPAEHASGYTRYEAGAPLIRGQPGDEVHELLGVADRCAVAEADKRGLERCESPRRLAVAHRIGREEVGRLMEPRHAGDHVHAVEHVAEDQRPVGLAPKGDMSGGVPGHVENPEPGHLVALVEGAVDRVPGASEEPGAHPRRRMVGLPGDHVAVLRRRHVGLAHPVRDAELRTHLPARALVVRVRVRQGVGGDLAALDLPENPPAGVARGRVHEHVADEVDVDRVRREAP